MQNTMKRAQLGMTSLDLLFVVIYLGFCSWIAFEIHAWLKEILTWPSYVILATSVIVSYTFLPLLSAVISISIRFIKKQIHNSPRHKAKVQAEMDEIRRINKLKYLKKDEDNNEE